MELGTAIVRGGGVVAAADLRHLGGMLVQQGHYVVVGEEMWVPQRVASEGTLSGLPRGPLGGSVDLVIGRRTSRGPNAQASDDTLFTMY